MSEFESVLPEILKGLKSTHGDDFFNQIVLQLDKVIDADYTFIASVNIDQQRAKTISMVVDGAFADNFEYELIHTPCAAVLDGRVKVYPQNIRNLFPQDQLLVDMDIEGYVGVALYNSHNEIIGIIVALYKTAIKDPQLAKILFELFSGRISAEMERAAQNNDLGNLNMVLESKVSALVASESHLKSIVDAIPDAIFFTDLQQNIVGVNEGSELIFGYNIDDLAGKTPSLFYASNEEYQHQVQLITNLAKEEKRKPLEVSYLRKDGTTFVGETISKPVNSADGQRLGFIGITKDITESKEKEERLELAASVFTHAREGIIITDPNAYIIDVNKTATEISGYSSAELIGLNASSFSTDWQSPEFHTHRIQLIVTDGKWSGEVWVRRKNGEAACLLQNVSAVYDEKGGVRNYVIMNSDITVMKKYQDQLERSAHYDTLTNLPNRILLSDRLNQAMVQCQRRNQSLAVVFLDLDGFKTVNDTYGHETGDEMLLVLAQRMKEALRQDDTLSRFGGDEFVGILTDVTGLSDCEPVLERLLKAAATPVAVGDMVMRVSASIGVTLYPQDGVDAEQLIRHADQAMYVAKQVGKNRYNFFDTAQYKAVTIQQESLGNIRAALQRREFVLHYQPKVNMRSGAVIGVEALIRWQHPERGLIFPVDFLPPIEGHAISLDIGEWVIDTALRQIGLWLNAGVQLPVSVNVSAYQLQQENFVTRLSELLNANPEVNPRDLELEILETSALSDFGEVAETMKACHALGVRFALDDFGTGYSSLTYLRRLPAHLIKIDQSFVRDMLNDADDLAIIEGVIALAKSFKREVIAEGVETIEHGAVLLTLGCELAQGYGIAKPMPAADIPDWMSAWTPDISWQS